MSLPSFNLPPTNSQAVMRSQNIPVSPASEFELSKTMKWLFNLLSDNDGAASNNYPALNDSAASNDDAALNNNTASNDNAALNDTAASNDNGGCSDDDSASSQKNIRSQTRIHEEWGDEWLGSGSSSESGTDSGVSMVGPLLN